VAAAGGLLDNQNVRPHEARYRDLVRVSCSNGRGNTYGYGPGARRTVRDLVEMAGVDVGTEN
jgi:hypothetical protein